MTDYYRPIPCETGRWQLAGGWVRFSQFELLARGLPPRVVDRAPDAVLTALTAPRPALLGLGMDQPRIMGIVNATPDSFSDGGHYDGAAQARLSGCRGRRDSGYRRQIRRPGAHPVPAAGEIDRIRPVIAAARRFAAISVDTRKAGVARAALAAGVGMVNDVSGLDFDPSLANVVADAGAPICLMHAQGVPSNDAGQPELWRRAVGRL